MFIPVFEKGLILKQHMLEALRDYPREFIRNLYSEYGDGIITGCHINIQDNMICIGEGIVKINGEVYILTKPLSVNAEDEINYVYLKITSESLADGTNLQMEVIQKNEKNDNLFEMARYTKNAVLKPYNKIEELFSDVSNRIDQRYVLQSVAGGNTLLSGYYRLYAEKVLSGVNADMQDIAFAYQCLNGIGSIEIVKAYFHTDDMSNQNILSLMKQRLSKLSAKSPEIKKSEPVQAKRPHITIS
ncbi:MAG: hypothetical protein IIT39_11735 [Clostridia bacterium]|nr:hypothetical protein [Clostridia bacterium]